MKQLDELEAEEIQNSKKASVLGCLPADISKDSTIRMAKM
jgi:hypothetical protein